MQAVEVTTEVAAAVVQRNDVLLGVGWINRSKTDPNGDKYLWESCMLKGRGEDPKVHHDLETIQK